MKIQLLGGAEVDLLSGGDLDRGIDRLLDGLAPSPDNKPIFQSRWAAEKTPAAGSSTTTLKLGKPRSGRAWNLVYLTVTGADDSTVVAGATVASYVGDPASPTLHGLIDPANGSVVPNSASFGEKQVWIHDDEELFLVVYGAPNGQQLSAVARVIDYPAAAIEARGQ